MKITGRDKAIIKKVAMYQCLTTSQVQRLYFDGLKNCQRRLRLLAKAGFLSFIPVPSVKPGKPENLYYLGNKGSELLNFPASKPRFTRGLTHQQKNTDLLIDIELAFRQTDIDCKIMPEHLIRIAGNQQIIPDGVIMLTRNNSVLFMLENDCSTEPLRSSQHNDLEAKLASYFTLFTDNNVVLYNRFFHKSFNRFRLLLVADNNTRFKAVSELVVSYDKHNFMFLTTLAKFKKYGITGNIWNLPAQDKSELSII